MDPDRFFCAAESRASGESIYGTVAHIRSWLLLEYHSVWRRRAVEDSRLLSDNLKHHLQRLERNRNIDRTLLIRREHTRTGPIQCFTIVSNGPHPRITRTLISDYDDVLTQPAGEPVTGLLYAACTHAHHDKCCARFGLPVYCALAELAGEQAWQCSHVGGDRFAANVVVFPFGLYYGRIVPDDVPELVRRSEAGEIWLERYRGRSSFTRAVQVAEYFARAESGRTAIDEFRPLATPGRTGSVTQVYLEARSDASIHLVEFATETAALTRLLTCGSTEPSTVPQYNLVRYSCGSREILPCANKL